MDSLISIDLAVSLYTEAPVVTSDLSIFTTQLTAYYETALTSIGAFTVMVPRQEECRGDNRYVRSYQMLVMVVILQTVACIINGSFV